MQLLIIAQAFSRQWLKGMHSIYDGYSAITKQGRPLCYIIQQTQIEIATYVGDVDPKASFDKY